MKAGSQTCKLKDDIKLVFDLWCFMIIPTNSNSNHLQKNLHHYIDEELKPWKYNVIFGEYF